MLEKEKVLTAANSQDLDKKGVTHIDPILQQPGDTINVLDVTFYDAGTPGSITLAHLLAFVTEVAKLFPLPSPHNALKEISKPQEGWQLP